MFNDSRGGAKEGSEARKDFGRKVQAHQSALVRIGLRELLESDSAFTSPLSSSDNILNLPNARRLSHSSDWSANSQQSISDRLSSPLTPPLPPTLPTPPAVTYNISFLDEYKHLFTPNCVVCQVQFKHVFRDYVITEALWRSQKFSIGEFVIVESHYDPMQIDMGILTKIQSLEAFKQMKSLRGRSQDKEENSVGRILRIANMQERQLLVPKHAREKPLLDVCRLFANAHQLAMNVYGVEFQFDGKILFIYYTADSRVDYRGLVYDMVRECNHTRVKMKKTNQCRRFIPKEYATMALATGLNSVV